MEDLNSDLTLEILKNLSGKDILSISKTSKKLNKICIGERYQKLWKEKLLDEYKVLYKKGDLTPYEKYIETMKVKYIWKRRRRMEKEIDLRDLPKIKKDYALFLNSQLAPFYEIIGKLENTSYWDICWEIFTYRKKKLTGQYLLEPLSEKEVRKLEKKWGYVIEGDFETYLKTVSAEFVYGKKAQRVLVNNKRQLFIGRYGYKRFLDEDLEVYAESFTKRLGKDDKVCYDSRVVGKPKPFKKFLERAIDMIVKDIYSPD